jgi:hypothetical protein
VLLLLLLLQGKVRVDQGSGELRLLVKVNVQGQGAEGRKSKAVKDLKQLSGGRGWGCCYCASSVACHAQHNLALIVGCK